jgi:ATP-binding cassette subfamily C protein CydC
MDRMDEILVLCKGKITERGTHSGLMAKRGSYYKMYNIQEQYLTENN